MSEQLTLDELRVAVAEKVMGWRDVEWKTFAPQRWQESDDPGLRQPIGIHPNGPNGSPVRGVLPHYPRDIAAAEDVLCKARGVDGAGKPGGFIIEDDADGGYNCGLCVHGVRGHGDTIAEAICRAALLAAPADAGHP